MIAPVSPLVVARGLHEVPQSLALHMSLHADRGLAVDVRGEAGHLDEAVPGIEPERGMLSVTGLQSKQAGTVHLPVCDQGCQ